MTTISDIIDQLDRFQPSAEDDEANVDHLYDILDGINEQSDKSDALEALFDVLERNPIAFLGNPGPIVHAIEKIPGYEVRLRQSVRSTPTYLNIWMVNRILNTDVLEIEREEWLALLRLITTLKEVDSEAKHYSQEFLEYQG